MKTFVIQTENGNIIHDFSFHLVEAVKYNNWYNEENIYNYCFSESTIINTTELIPVGSVEFVLDFLKTFYNIDNIKPLNIPPELMKPEYLKRWVKIVKTDSPTFNAGDEPIFVKDNTKIKGFCNIITKNQGYPAGEWLVSEVVGIESEWRVFVFNNQLVGLQNYSGDFTLFPDVDLINEMIISYQGQNPTYTLDVGVSGFRGTFLIECGKFFSSGLYGFADYRILPRMFIATWNKLIGKEV